MSFYIQTIHWGCPCVQFLTGGHGTLWSQGCAAQTKLQILSTENTLFFLNNMPLFQRRICGYGVTYGPSNQCGQCCNISSSLCPSLPRLSQPPHAPPSHLSRGDSSYFIMTRQNLCNPEPLHRPECIKQNNRWTRQAHKAKMQEGKMIRFYHNMLSVTELCNVIQ